MHTPTEQYMQRCLELAELGKGNVAPNPMVGCVIVADGKIIGEGWHQQYGGPHAEVNAIAAVNDQSLLSKSIVYVNLEPCSHFGKTPPCADLLIRHKVQKVVIGMIDPFSEVAGRGIQKLKDAGIEVEVGLSEDACKELNKRFIVFHEQKRPYVILKWAQTADGFISPDSTKISAESYNDQRHITGKTVQVLVHKWRSEEAAIMAGTRTVLIDNPRLDTRAYPGNNPLRVVIDKDAALPHSLHVFDGTQPTIVFTSTEKVANPNALTSYVKIDFSQPVWPQILSVLFARDIQSIIVEGGLATLQAIFDSAIWDEAQVFTTPKILKEGVRAPQTRGVLQSRSVIDGARLELFHNR